MSSPAAVPAARSIIYLGMDVHKDSITIAVLPEGAKAPTRLERLPNALPTLKKWIERLARDGEIQACSLSAATHVMAQRRCFQICGLRCPCITAMTEMSRGRVTK